MGDEQQRDTSSPAGARSERDGGFALLLVLWIAGLLALFSATLASAALDYVRSTRNAVVNERARQLAEGGIRLSLAAVADAEAAGSTLPYELRTPSACRLPDGETLVITVSDEAGKVDLNTATPALLATLLAGTGLAAEQAKAIAAAIADWRDGDDQRSPGGAERAEYRAAGRTQGPKNAPFDTPAELASVLGIDQPLYLRLRPFLTIHSGLAGVDASLAAPELLDILARGADAVSIASARLAVDGRSIPTDVLAMSQQQVLGLRAEAIMPDGTRAAREAVALRLEGVLSRRSLPAMPASVDDSVAARPQAGNRQSPTVTYRIAQWRKASPSTTVADGNPPAC